MIFAFSVLPAAFGFFEFKEVVRAVIVKYPFVPFHHIKAVSVKGCLYHIGMFGEYIESTVYLVKIETGLLYEILCISEGRQFRCRCDDACIYQLCQYVGKIIFGLCVSTDLPADIRKPQSAVYVLQEQITGIETELFSFLMQNGFRYFYRDLHSRTFFLFRHYCSLFSGPGDDLVAVIVMERKKGSHRTEFPDDL